MGSVVFSIERNYVEFELLRKNGEAVQLRWYEPSVKVMSALGEAAADMSKMLPAIKSALEESLEPVNGNKKLKEELIAELLDNMGALELFEMINQLTNLIQETRQKKPNG